MGTTFDRKKLKQKDKAQAVRLKKPERQTLPNSLVMRIMEDQQAENEADKLSQGVTSATPDALREEMGSRLGADFSNVQFHSDSLSMSRSKAMGARAWAQGSDVYFGKGGFDPKVAAHELVHTVQQGAVHGNVSESMPMGAVQLLPSKGENDDDAEIKPNYALKESDVQQMLAQIFSTDMGKKVYNRIEKTLKETIKKGAGKNFPYTKSKGIEFLAVASGKDYSSKGILSTIMQKRLASKDIAKDVAYEYEQYINLISKRMGPFGLEDVAIKTELISQPPRYQHAPAEHKRAYDTEMPEDKTSKKVFNPNNNPELAAIQNRIDKAPDVETAYSVFAAYTGNTEGRYIDEYGMDPDVNLFKNKLKHMARVVYDYPELRRNIGDMNVTDPAGSALMSTEGSAGGIYKIDFSYDANYDRKGEAAEKKRERDLNISNKYRHYNTWSMDTVGTHEMGHAAVSLLPDSDVIGDRLDEENNYIHENDILNTVIRNTDVLTEDQKKEIKYYDKDKKIKKNSGVLKGQIDPKASKFYENGLTSKYGTYSSAELFSESFHDIYANGKDAKPLSKEIVKEYEKRQRKLTEKRFKKKAKRGFFRKFIDLFKF